MFNFMTTEERKIISIIYYDHGKFAGTMNPRRAQWKFIEKHRKPDKFGYNNQYSEPLWQEYQKLYEFLISRFNDAKDKPLAELIYRLENDIEKAPSCPVCGNEIQYRNHLYGLFCSNTCMGSIKGREIINEKTKATMLRRFGVEHNMKSDESKNKKKETCLKIYGATNPFGNKEIMAKAEKTRRPAITKALKSEKSKNKKKQTCLERYGTEYYYQSKDFRDKAKATWLKKYGVPEPGMLKSVHEKGEATKSKGGRRYMSVSEVYAYDVLLTRFDKDDIVFQYKDDRYKNPITNRRINCDFYIKSLDIFIEIQAYWSHGYYPFVEGKSSVDDTQWICQKETWGKYDRLKRKAALENNLNYIEVFSGQKTYIQENLLKGISECVAGKHHVVLSQFGELILPKENSQDY